MARMQAALLGAREVGFTVVSMSLSLVAVFIPFMFVGGIVGRLFKRIHRHPVGGDPDLAGGFADHHADDVFAAAATAAANASRRASRRLSRPDSSACAAATSARSAGRCDHPRIDDGGAASRRSDSTSTCTSSSRRDSFRSRTPVSCRAAYAAMRPVSFQLMKGKLQQVAKIIQDDPAVKTVTGSVGSGGFVRRRRRDRQCHRCAQAASSRGIFRPTKSSRGCGRSSIA